jgi:beta-lactamase regulating signal transducer with metallopeptidase domain
MSFILHFPFFENLGFAIINSFWQMIILWLFVVSIRYFLNISVKSSYIIAVLAQFAGFGWFIYTIFHPFRFSSIQNGLPVIGYSENKLNIINYISIIYILFLILNYLKLIKDFHYSSRIRKNGISDVSEHIQNFIDNNLLKLEIRKKVKISLSRLVNSPLTTGYIKPIILLPVAIVNHLTQEQLEAIILHELIHVKRKDYIVNIIQILIEKILYFNPFIKLIGNISRTEREKICDREALKLSCTNQSYAEALFFLAKNNTNSLLSIAATGGNKMELLERIRIILGINIKKRFIPVRQLVGTVLAGCVTLSVFMLLNQKNKPSVTVHANNKYASTLSYPIENVKWQRLEKPVKTEITGYKEIKNQSVANKTHKNSRKITGEPAKAAPLQDEIVNISAPEIVREVSETNSLSINYKVNLNNPDSIRMLNRLINTIVSKEGISESGNYYALASYRGKAGNIHVLSENTSYIKTSNYTILIKKDDQFFYVLIKANPSNSLE